jgi:hypothetical protein
VHPAASVIVQVYIPALLEEVVADVPPPGDQRNVYEPVPPLAVIDAPPLLPPLHDTLDTEVTDELICPLTVTVTCVRELAPHVLSCT